MGARQNRRWREVTVPRVIRRDGGVCHLCGHPGADTADHLVPVAHGGDDTEDNLAAAHRRCNRIRGDRSITWARNRIASMGMSVVAPATKPTRVTSRQW